MEKTRTQPPIAEQVKSYLETKVKLLKYEAIDKSSAVIAEIVADVVIALLLVLAFIFLSVTLALFAGYLLHSESEGFCCVTMLYVLLALSGHLLKGRLQNILIRKLIEKLFRERTQVPQSN